MNTCWVRVCKCLYTVCLCVCVPEADSKTDSARIPPDSLRQALFIEPGADPGGLLGSLLPASSGITNEPLHLTSAHVEPELYPLSRLPCPSIIFLSPPTLVLLLNSYMHRCTYPCILKKPHLVTGLDRIELVCEFKLASTKSSSMYCSRWSPFFFA